LFPKQEPEIVSKCHLEGLRHITSHFAKQGPEYTHFLYLDCDAFPIKQDWLPELSSHMEEQPMFNGGMYSRMVGRSYDIAALVRAENLETRLHASVLLVRRKAFHKVSFKVDTVGIDLRGDAETDIHLPAYEAEEREMAYALMRSNKMNIHPLACGVYYNMFYHHACGSRKKTCQTVRGNWLSRAGKPYWEPFGKLNTEGFTTQLIANPSAFIAGLAGWTPNRYAVL